MSVIHQWEGYDERRTASSECISSPRDRCNNEVLQQLKLERVHSQEDTSLSLSDEEISCLRRALSEYQVKSICKAILARDALIQKYFDEIAKAKKECTATIDSILTRETRGNIKDLCAKKSIPLFSNNPFVQSLASLKQSSNLSKQSVLDLLSFPPKTIPKENKSNLKLESLQTVFLYDPIIPQWELYKTSQGHDKEITSVAISDCEKYFASASFDHTIKIWELKSLELIHTLIGHTQWVFSVVYLGDKVVSGSYDKTLKVWEEEKCVDTLEIHAGGITSLCVSFSKKLLASGSWDRTVKVLNAQDFNTLVTLEGHSNVVDSVVFSPDDKELVSGSLDKTIKIWKTETGELLRTLNGHSSRITCVNHSGSYVLSSSWDHTIQVWDVQKDQVTITLTEHSSCVFSIDLWKHLLVSLGNDNCLRLWDTRTGSLVQTLTAHGEYTSTFPWLYDKMGLKFLRNGRYILSAGWDGTIKLWRRSN